MARRPLIIDCDPGQDDAIALMVAFSARDLFDIKGITTVAGNVPLRLTEANARRIRDLATDEAVQRIPVHAGCPRPLLEPLETAEHVHGRTGIDGAGLPDPVGRLADGHAVDFLIQTLRDAPEPVTLATLGPLTNIAVALAMAPDIVEKVAELVMMGGSAGRGNVTPVAEFNIRTDPHAAAMVFAAGWDITMFGLNLTHQVRAGADEIARLRALATPAGNAVARDARFLRQSSPSRRGGGGGVRCPAARPLCHRLSDRSHPVQGGASGGDGGDCLAPDPRPDGVRFCGQAAQRAGDDRGPAEAALDLIIGHIARL